MDVERCHECGASFAANDERAEVYLDPRAMKANAGGQAVLVDELPDDAFGPFLVHADPCYLGTLPKYVLA